MKITPSINSTTESLITPFLKWAGGKRWFAKKIIDFLPESFTRYIEPFLGSGAIFFALQPKKAILSDVNVELINAYKAIRDYPTQVHALLEGHQRNHSEAFYYEMRERIPATPWEQAARTIYLNRTCWNGLYRVNLQGRFNVPKGTKDKVLMDSDNFELISSTLKGSKIVVSDFEPIIDSANQGDFIFVDPPYTVKHNVNGFVKYNEKIFTWEDQLRLRDATYRAAERGAKVLITNADHSSIRSIYSHFRLVSMERSSVISGKSSGRGYYDELVIKSW